jgi:hypothetical protein
MISTPSSFFLETLKVVITDDSLILELLE